MEVGGNLQLGSGSTIVSFSNNGTLASASNQIAPTQQAVKNYVDNNGSSGLERINEGNGFGWRLRGRFANNFVDIGINVVDLSFSNNPIYGASGVSSCAVGDLVLASGRSSVATG